MNRHCAIYKQSRFPSNGAVFSVSSSVFDQSYKRWFCLVLFGGAGAILINFVLCWAVVARVTRARVVFIGDADETLMLFDCNTSDDADAVAGVVVVVVGMRSSSAIASCIAFSN